MTEDERKVFEAFSAPRTSENRTRFEKVLEGLPPGSKILRQAGDLLESFIVDLYSGRREPSPPSLEEGESEAIAKTKAKAKAKARTEGLP